MNMVEIIDWCFLFHAVADVSWNICQATDAASGFLEDSLSIVRLSRGSSNLQVTPKETGETHAKKHERHEYDS